MLFDIYHEKEWKNMEDNLMNVEEEWLIYLAFDPDVFPNK